MVGTIPILPVTILLNTVMELRSAFHVNMIFGRCLARPLLLLIMAGEVVEARVLTLEEVLLRRMRTILNFVWH